MGHELAEAAFREGALLEPEKVFLREIKDRDTPWRVFFFPEHAERDVCLMNFREKVPEVFAIDFSEVHDFGFLYSVACGEEGGG